VASGVIICPVTAYGLIFLLLHAAAAWAMMGYAAVLRIMMASVIQIARNSRIQTAEIAPERVVIVASQSQMVNVIQTVQ
jgi:hypothetical protein